MRERLLELNSISKSNCSVSEIVQLMQLWQGNIIDLYSVKFIVLELCEGKE